MFYVDKIKQRIEEVAVSEMDIAPEAARDVAFHMTDWLEDLEAYSEFCRDPQALSREKAGKLLLQFLIHVPNHLAAASRLYADIPVTDVFGVGATTDDAEDT
jgi:hypothetical protein